MGDNGGLSAGDVASQIVLKLIEGPGNVTNVSTKVVKS